MLFDRTGQDCMVDRHGAIRRRRNPAVEVQVEPQCRRVAARATALGRMTGTVMVGRRGLGMRGGVLVRGTIVLALHIANRRSVRKTARHQLPEEQQDCKAESWAMACHAGILSFAAWLGQGRTSTQAGDGTLAESADAEVVPTPGRTGSDHRGLRSFPTAD